MSTETTANLTHEDRDAKGRTTTMWYPPIAVVGVKTDTQVIVIVTGLIEEAW